MEERPDPASKRRTTQFHLAGAAPNTAPLDRRCFIEGTGSKIDAYLPGFQKEFDDAFRMIGIILPRFFLL